MMSLTWKSNIINPNKIILWFLKTTIITISYLYPWVFRKHQVSYEKTLQLQSPSPLDTEKNSEKCMAKIYKTNLPFPSTKPDN